MTAIAPVLFYAYPEDASHNAAGPSLQCFNASESADGVEALSAPFKWPRAIWASVALIILGLAPVAVTGMILVALVASHHPDPFGDVTEWTEPLGLPSAVLLAAGFAWSLFLTSSLNPNAKAWKKALGDAWAAHGAEITVLRTLSNQTRKDVLEYGDTLEKIRKSLNRLDPEGDELDVVRYRLQRYIEASNLPALGAKAAAATHVKDPLVRQAAKEYKAMLEQKKLARRALDDSIAEAGIVLATRLQARSDAELIKLVHER